MPSQEIVILKFEEFELNNCDSYPSPRLDIMFYVDNWEIASRFMEDKNFMKYIEATGVINHGDEWETDKNGKEEKRYFCFKCDYEGYLSLQKAFALLKKAILYYKKMYPKYSKCLAKK